jgi:hypothetical protein
MKLEEADIKLGRRRTFQYSTLGRQAPKVGMDSTEVYRHYKVGARVSGNFLEIRKEAMQ